MCGCCVLAPVVDEARHVAFVGGVDVDAHCTAVGRQHHPSHLSGGVTAHRAGGVQHTVKGVVQGRSVYTQASTSQHTTRQEHTHQCHPPSAHAPHMMRGRQPGAPQHRVWSVAPHRTYTQRRRWVCAAGPPPTNPASCQYWFYGQILYTQV